VVSLLAHSLPASNADRLGLLRDLRKHRVVRFNDGEGAGSMEMLLSVLRPVMSYVSDEALDDALTIAGQAAALRASGAADRDSGIYPAAGSDPTAVVPLAVEDATAVAPAQGRLL
jgi:hypothetical protein